MNHLTKSIQNDLDLAARLLNIGIDNVCSSQCKEEAVIMRSVRLILNDLYCLIDRQQNNAAQKQF